MFGLTLLGFFAGAISVFLMFLILIQRGKGGGLTGALGGMGGQSAFGSKAGDLFTRITVITAIIWMTTCLLIIKVYNFPPATAEVQDTSGEVSGDGEDAGAGAGITGEGGGDFVPEVGDDTTPGENEDPSDDPVIGDGETPAEGEGESTAEGENGDDDLPIIDPDAGAGETESGEGETGETESGEGAGETGEGDTGDTGEGAEQNDDN